MFRFPGEYIETLKGQISPQFVAANKGPVNESSYPDIYNLEPGLVYNASDNFKVTMKLSLDNGVSRFFAARHSSATSELTIHCQGSLSLSRPTR